MLVFRGMIDETGRFQKLIIGLSGQESPRKKLRFRVETFRTSLSYNVIFGFRKV